MNKNYISIFFSMLFFIHIASSQHISSCCHLSSVQEFANLGKDLSFVMAHEAPLPFLLENPKGKMITFPVKDEMDGSGYLISADVKTDKWILLLHEWWGLNDYIKSEADKLSNEFPDCHILALDLYDGNVAASREDASRYMQNAKPERIESIIRGAGLWGDSRKKMVTLGWCFGGACSLKSAVLLQNLAVGCVIYYGMPIKDESQIDKIKVPVLGIFADKDGWITPKVVGDFESLMKKYQKEVEIHHFDADHAFANPSNPGYHKIYTDQAWDIVRKFIKKSFN